MVARVLKFLELVLVFFEGEGCRVGSFWEVINVRMLFFVIFKVMLKFIQMKLRLFVTGINFKISCQIYLSILRLCF